MSLMIYNSLGRSKQEFVPQNKDLVTMYVCGPTVYDFPHIGHAKSYISFDVIVRYLRHLGYRVRYVQNITDVGHLLDSGEDRILKGAKREQVNPMELVEKYTRAYFEAMDALNVLRPDISPHAAAHIPEQIEFVQGLIDKGYAYASNGSVYFDVEKWDEYGKLSGRKVEDQQAGARIDVNSEKRHPADFALWKKAEPEHIMQWNSPWGKGYPGWHIECSAMSMKYLGETIDIHGGGMENQFPHHECEIAQSESLTGKPFVKYWLHNNMVMVDGVKMGKSLNNFTTVADALGKFTGQQIRFFVLQSHYRSPIDFSDKALTAAGQGLDRLANTANSMQQQLDPSLDGSAAGQAVQDLCADMRARFEKEMNDDFNTPNAIGSLFDFSKEINKQLQEGGGANAEDVALMYKTFTDLSGGVLGLEFAAQQQAVEATPLIDLLLEVRQALRAQKDWTLTDLIRDRMAEYGIELKDSKDGTFWSVKN